VRAAHFCVLLTGCLFFLHLPGSQTPHSDVFTTCIASNWRKVALSAGLPQLAYCRMPCCTRKGLLYLASILHSLHSTAVCGCRSLALYPVAAGSHRSAFQRGLCGWLGQLRDAQTFHQTSLARVVAAVHSFEPNVKSLYLQD